MRMTNDQFLCAAPRFSRTKVSWPQKDTKRHNKDVPDRCQFFGDCCYRLHTNGFLAQGLRNVLMMLLRDGKTRIDRMHRMRDEKASVVHPVHPVHPCSFLSRTSGTGHQLFECDWNGCRVADQLRETKTGIQSNCGNMTEGFCVNARAWDREKSVQIASSGSHAVFANSTTPFWRKPTNKTDDR